MAEEEIFNSITSGKHVGSFRIHSGGIQWQDKQGGHPLSFKPRDLPSVDWCVTGKTGIFGVDDGTQTYRFGGFRESDYGKLAEFVSRALDKELTETPLCSHGLNWGTVSFTDNSLELHSAAKEGQEPLRLLDINLSAVAKATVTGTGKNMNEVLLDFHDDDTVADKDEESIVAIKFYAPPAAQYDGAEETGAAALHQMVTARASITEIGAGDGIVSFDQVPIVAPRGRFDIELHEKFLSMRSGSQDFKIMYTNFSRLLYLPATRHNHVMIQLENPIRKGASPYYSIIAQYDAEFEGEITLNLPDDKFEQYGGKLAKEMEGNMAQLFIQTLSSLSGKKIYKPSKSYHAAQDVTQKYIRCSLKAQDGFLFPCDKFFVFIYKPSTIMRFEDIRAVEFARMQKVGGQAMNTFELAVTMKSDTRYDFNGIGRGEYNNLFNFLTDKGIQIQNVDDAGPVEESDDGNSEEEMREDAKRAARRERASGADADDLPDSEEEDESYEDSEDEDDDDDDGDDDDDDDDEVEAAAPKKSKEPKKRKQSDEPAKKTKKKRAKKDKNAPKKPKGAYILFGMDKRPEILAANPGIGITEVAKLIGAAWKECSAEDKAKYDTKVQEDKERYEREMEEYKKKTEGADAEDGSDSDEDEDDE